MCACWNLKPDFTSKLELRLTSPCFILPIDAMKNFGVPNANPCTKFDVKSGLNHDFSLTFDSYMIAFFRGFKWTAFYYSKYLGDFIVYIILCQQKKKFTHKTCKCKV